MLLLTCMSDPHQICFIGGLNGTQFMKSLIICKLEGLQQGGYRHSKEYIVDDEDVGEWDEHEDRRREEEYQARYQVIRLWPVIQSMFLQWRTMRIHAEGHELKEEKAQWCFFGQCWTGRLQDFYAKDGTTIKAKIYIWTESCHGKLKHSIQYTTERPRDQVLIHKGPQTIVLLPRRSPIPIDRSQTRDCTDSP